MTGRQRAAGPDEARPGLGPPGEASLWQVAHAYGGRRSAGRSVERDSANEEVARQRAERRKGPLPVGQSRPGQAGSSLVSVPAPALASTDNGAPGGEAAARRGLSDAVGGAAPLRRTKPGSDREPSAQPTHVGSGASPSCALKIAPGGKGVAIQRAELRTGERSPSPPGEARVGQGAHSCGVRPRAGPRSRRRARRQGRQKGWATQGGREGRSPSPAGEARVGPGAHSFGVQPIAGLRCRRRARRRRQR